MRLRVQLLDRLREDVRRGMAKDVQFLFLRALGHAAIVVDDLHTNTSLLSPPRAGTSSVRFAATFPIGEGLFTWDEKTPVPRVFSRDERKKYLPVVPP